MSPASGVLSPWYMPSTQSSLLKSKSHSLLSAVLSTVVALSLSNETKADTESSPNAWSIGVATGSSPLRLTERRSPLNPVFTHRDIATPPTSFVADPFLVRDGERWNLFFELFNTESKRGELGVAESADLLHWRFLKVILAEPFHLSYPYVLKYKGSYFMIPESKEGKAIRLYRATRYPLEWEFEKVLVEGEYVDPSPVFFNGRWWLFAGHDGYSTSLFYADDLKGPWTKHPQSPIYQNNPSMARPGGRSVVVDGQLIRFVQDNPDGYGKGVRAMVVDEISPTTFKEHPATTSSLFKAHGQHWARNGMHHVAPVEVAKGEWVATIDGSGDGKSDR